MANTITKTRRRTNTTKEVIMVMANTTEPEKRVRRKLCDICHKHEVAFITRRPIVNAYAKKDIITQYICKECAPRFIEYGIVSYNKG